MGPKKKGAKQGEEEDLSTRDLQLYYRKKCKELEIPLCKMLDTKLTEVQEEDEHLHEILVNEKIGETGTRAISDALKTTNKGKGYKHIQSIRVWDGDISDEGVRAIHQFVIDTNNASLKLLELLNCNIGPLGCEFISRMFEPSLPTNISILTLDYNAFGNVGLFYLMQYIKENRTLTYLSLAYCGIDENGVEHLEKYLLHTQTLESFNLQGNPLKNSGMAKLITCLFNNISIVEINLNNILFGQDVKLMESFSDLMENNKNILVYHIKFNFIGDDDFQVLLNALKGGNCKHIYSFNIDEKISKALFDQFFKTMKGRKPPKKKKGLKKKK